MEPIQKRKKVDIIVTVTSIAIGIFIAVFFDRLIGFIMIAGGSLVSYKEVLFILGKFFNAKGTLFKHESTKNVHLYGGRENEIGAQIGNVDGVVNLYGQIPEKSHEGRNVEFEKEKRAALKDINDRIVECMDRLNRQANMGVRNKDDYTATWQMIEEFKIAKMKNKVYFDSPLINVLSEVLGSFRKTRADLGRNDAELELNVGLRGTEYFEFNPKCEEAQSMIAERLK